MVQGICLAQDTYPTWETFRIERSRGGLTSFRPCCFHLPACAEARLGIEQIMRAETDELDVSQVVNNQLILSLPKYNQRSPRCNSELVETRNLNRSNSRNLSIYCPRVTYLHMPEDYINTREPCNFGAQ